MGLLKFLGLLSKEDEEFVELPKLYCANPNCRKELIGEGSFAYHSGTGRIFHRDHYDGRVVREGLVEGIPEYLWREDLEALAREGKVSSGG